jgi:membrane protein
MSLFKFHVRKESVEKTKEKTSPWKLGGLSAYQLGKRVWHEIDHDEVFTRSAALSYYFFSALIPMVFFLMAVLGMFASQSEHLRATLLNYAGQMMPPMAFALVEKTLREISTTSTGWKLLFGLALSLWSGAGGMSSIIDALNRCYHVNESRPYWKKMLVAICLTIGIAVLMICALTIVLYGGDIAKFVGNHIGLSGVTVFVWRVVQWPIALFFVVW